MGTKKNGLELYLHIPFCIKKCDYCDFLSGPSTRARAGSLYLCTFTGNGDGFKESEKTSGRYSFHWRGNTFCAGM